MCFTELRALRQYSMCVRISVVFFLAFIHNYSTFHSYVLGLPNSSCGIIIIDYHIYRRHCTNNISIRLLLLLFLLINLETNFLTETLRVAYVLIATKAPIKSLFFVGCGKKKREKRERAMTRLNENKKRMFRAVSGFICCIIVCFFF